MRTLLIISVVLAASSAQNTQRTTPVPILKQINTHNDDGSYTYGYEGADGSFKIETKLATGEVHGKYGYVDSDGKVREIEYGASRRGFEPAGTDINVPPAVINPGNALDYDDGSYKDDPDYYNEYKRTQNRRTNAPSRSVFKNQPKPAAVPAPEPVRYDAPAPVTTRFTSPAVSTQQWTAPAAPAQWNGPAARQQWSAPSVPAQQWNPASQQWNAPAPRQQWNTPQWNNAQQSAANVNLQTGSYSLSYVG